VGIGPTKTQAKLANHLAKRHPDFAAAGVWDWLALSAVAELAVLQVSPGGGAMGALADGAGGGAIIRSYHRAPGGVLLVHDAAAPVPRLGPPSPDDFFAIGDQFIK
jgi:hypothetical protein